MTYQVIVADSAMDDMIETMLYVMERWGEERADVAYASLKSKFDLLATQPKLGRAVPELVAHGISNFRLYVHEGHTKFLYRIDDVNKTVTIRMIFSSHQDFQALLFDRILRHPSKPSV